MKKFLNNFKSFKGWFWLMLLVTVTFGILTNVENWYYKASECGYKAGIATAVLAVLWAIEATTKAIRIRKIVKSLTPKNDNSL